MAASSASAVAAAAASCANTAKTWAASSQLTPIQVLRIPHLVPYSLGTALQEHLYRRRIDARAFLRELPSASPAGQLSSSNGGNERETRARAVASTDHLLLLQHAPVYTEGKRQKELNAELAEACQRNGVDYVLARRGGLITYHGVGQITGYPQLDLASMDLSVKCYVSYLETLFRKLLESPRYGLSSVEPPDGHTGVWADEYHKIVSLGVQVRHRLTLDGFGFNVSDAPLDFFRMIVACGIQGRFMTTLHSELRKRGESAASADGTTQTQAPRPSTASLMPIVAEHFGQQFGRQMRDVGQEDVSYEMEQTSAWTDDEGKPAHKLTAITLYGERIAAPEEAEG
ncbi:hypothetical protein OC844_000749 [Tilletia horrida]|nr:hypothetical protein OC844_000749 [Tilletia horrida]